MLSIDEDLTLVKVRRPAMEFYLNYVRRDRSSGNLWGKVILEREKGGRRSNGDLESRSTPTDLRSTKVKYYEKPREKNMSSLSGLHCREDVVNYAFNSGS